MQIFVISNGTNTKYYSNTTRFYHIKELEMGGRNHPVFQQRVVIIFDECHRSNFGDMQLKTTQHAFGNKLHTYTIVDTINDGNVLPFRIDYVNTIAVKDDIAEKQVPAIDREKGHGLT